MAITINGTTGLSGVDGSAGTPALHGSDPNTGIYYPGANQVAVATDGTGRLFVDASGNVGVGTSGPAAVLTTYAGGFDPSDNTVFDGVGLFLESSVAGGDGNYGSALAWNRPGSSTNFKCAIAPVQEGADVDVQGLAFFTANGTFTSSDPVERLRIDSSGNLQFNSGYGSVATAYGCRAWVNFNGTGAVAIRASGNVSSITDNGTGAYTVNFATALPDANYAHEAQGSSTLTDGNLNIDAKTHTAATGSVKVRASNNAATNTASDQAEIRVVIFR